MGTSDLESVDLSTKTIRAYFDAPISVSFCVENLTLSIDNASASSQYSRLNVQAVFTHQAIRQLISSLKQIETALNEEALKQKEEKTVPMTNFLDQSDIL